MITANISQVKMIYQFNSKIFIRAISQYRNYQLNQDLYEDVIDEKSQRLFLQLLFSYKINPRTVLFLGYSDFSNGYGVIELTKTDRTVFFKIGYALNL